MKVLVSGGGIGGLVTAIAPQQRGIDVTILERTTELRPVGARITLWINAMKALRKVGLADAIARVGEPALDGDTCTWRGRLLTHSLARELVSRHGEMVVAVHRADLQRVLLDAVGEGVIRLGAECTGFEGNTNGVTVCLSDGTTERADVFVGADGLWSTVLADSLAQQPDPVQALRSYERARIPRTTMLIEQSRRIGRVGQLQNPAATWLRDPLLAAIPARFQLEQLEPIVGYDV